MKKVNVLVQVMATIFIPTGIYAFWRIGKTRIGIVSYIASFCVGVISGVLSFISTDNYHLVISIIGIFLSIMLPMGFMVYYTNQYNTKLKA